MVTGKLICIFVFAYAKSWFSHDAAHFMVNRFYLGVNQLQMKIELALDPGTGIKLPRTV